LAFYFNPVLVETVQNKTKKKKGNSGQPQDDRWKRKVQGKEIK
jgi:hypothetical protein